VIAACYLAGGRRAAGCAGAEQYDAELKRLLDAAVDGYATQPSEVPTPLAERSAMLYECLRHREAHLSRQPGTACHSVRQFVGATYLLLTRERVDACEEYG
jgi:hypothetical protein